MKDNLPELLSLGLDIKYCEKSGFGTPAGYLYGFEFIQFNPGLIEFSEPT